MADIGAALLVLFIDVVVDVGLMVLCCHAAALVLLL